MLTVINITIPFFLLIFMGCFLKHIKLLKDKASDILAKVAFFVLMPSMVYLKISSIDSGEFLNLRFILFYELGTIILFLIVFPAKRIFKFNLNTLGLFSLNCNYPNYGYIGIPMALFAFGDAAAAPIALILFSNTLILLFITSLYISFYEGAGSLRRSFETMLKTTVSNPLIIAVTAGVISSATDINLPEFIHKTLILLADSAPSVALIALGASLSFNALQSSQTEILVLSFIKLIVHPIVICVLFLLWSKESLVWVQTAVLCASLPIATNVFMLANHFGVYQKQSANAIMLSTLFSTLTVPTILFFLLEKLYIP